jgi:hypothetical protein
MNQGNIQFYGDGGGGGGAVAGADNGLSFSDPVVELGQSPGAGGDPGKLLSNREIPLNGFSIAIPDTLKISDGETAVLPGAHWFAGGPDAGDNQVSNYLQPANYGTVYPIGNGNTSRNPGRFMQGWGTYHVNAPDPRPNVVGMMWGYNVNLGGNPVIAGEASIRFGTETYYHQQGTTLVELHLPEFGDEAGRLHRITSTYIDRKDGAANQQNEIESVEYYTRGRFNNDNAWFSLGVTPSGQVAVNLNSAAGTGGVSPGDESNFSTLALYGGDGHLGLLRVGTGFDMTLEYDYGPINMRAKFLALTDFIQFSWASSYFGDHIVRLQSMSGDANKGFLFWDNSQNVIADISLNDFKVIGTLNLASHTPINNADNNVWIDGGHLFVRLAGTNIQLA